LAAVSGLLIGSLGGVKTVFRRTGDFLSLAILFEKFWPWILLIPYFFSIGEARAMFSEIWREGWAGISSNLNDLAIGDFNSNP